MSRERDEFMHTMAREGVPVDVCRKVLRHAATHHRCAELECSSEWADRDRVPCPGVKTEGACLCDYGYAEEGKHESVPRVSVTAQRMERLITAALAPYNVVPVFQGDPRGATVKLKVPSGKADSWDGVGICVPVGR
jgi:hypothetical protein